MEVGAILHTIQKTRSTAHTVKDRKHLLRANLHNNCINIRSSEAVEHGNVFRFCVTTGSPLAEGQSILFTVAIHTALNSYRGWAKEETTKEKTGKEK